MTQVSDGPDAPAAPDEQPERLLQAAGRGDRRAFEALYERFARPLMAFLFAFTRDRALAEDLVQETFVRAWKAAPRWQPRARASTWLFTIARNVAASARPRRRPPGPPAPPARAAEQAVPPDPLLGQRLAAAVAALSPTLRETFVLVRLNGLSLAETAGIVGAPVGTVKSRLAAAEAQLRVSLRGLAPDAGAHR